ncbi:hypothetical protein P7K49_016067 [Saguinus oedipus]|uniref:Uncharacterized protein n=1 Tax=Saguinus oedipus TaxID=9490 RepID=A0ABQ9VD20_SAGOE|nr:hypothetical protein P7K49_016067 [Saguinus oedipus]
MGKLRPERARGRGIEFESRRRQSRRPGPQDRLTQASPLATPYRLVAGHVVTLGELLRISTQGPLQHDRTATGKSLRDELALGDPRECQRTRVPTALIPSTTTQ